MKGFLWIVCCCLLLSASAAAQQWRLKQEIKYGLSIHAPQQVILDLLVYHYSNTVTRGSSPKLDTIKYDSLYVFYDNNKLAAMAVQSFSANNDVLSNTIIRLPYSPTSDTSQSDTFKYANGNIVEHTHHNNFGNSWNPYRKTESSYNTSGQLTERIYYRWSLPNKRWEYTGYLYRTYNGNGTIAIDSTMVSDSTIYPLWDSITRHVYAYNTGGLLTDKLSYLIIGNNNDTITNVNYQYNGMSQLVSDSLHIYQGSSVWKNVVYGTYVYHPGGELYIHKQVNIDGFKRYLSWTDTITQIYRYDQKGLLIQFDSLEADSNNIDLWLTYYYDYELYWPAGVSYQYKDIGNISLYPIPAQDVLQLNCHFENPGYVNCCITDMQGRKVRHWQDKATGNYHKQIYTVGMPAGMYMLTINTGVTTISKQFIVSN